ncbi:MULTISPECIES: hypothetical protein [Actinosynnema]|uniref:hypothetical protein n=1 Tax=Actinosynnema TaxID=40566 RepID=UPI0031DD901B
MILGGAVRAVVWVPGGVDEVRERLRTRAGRPRRLVPTANGVFLLGPAPVVVAELEDAAEAATATPSVPAVALSWDERHARAHVRRGDGRVVGVFEQPETPLAVAEALGIDRDTALRAAAEAAEQVGYTDDDTIGAEAVERWAVFLERAGVVGEGRALRWIAGADLPVPEHRKRPWERRFGELGFTGDEHDWQLGVKGQVFKLTIAVVVMVSALVVVLTGDGHPLLLVAILVGVVGLLHNGAEAALFFSRHRHRHRHRRPDPFPVSEPDHPEVGAPRAGA